MFDSIKPHLAELRKRFMVIAISLLITFIIAFIFYSPILHWITQPLNDALSSAGSLQNHAVDGKVTTHQVGGAFFVALKVSFLTAFIASVPVILWQIWAFVAPGLYDNEKRYLLPFVIGGTVMFLLGTLFSYYVVTPFGFEFLIVFGSENFTPYINIEDYVGFFGKFLIGFGLAFELPIVIAFMAKMGLVTNKTLSDFFRYAILIIFVVSAILTPPDVLTQLLMAGPLVVLYGISIIIAKIINPHIDEVDDE
jgi:sec-independent protein translocase protein TatC